MRLPIIGMLLFFGCFVGRARGQTGTIATYGARARNPILTTTTSATGGMPNVTLAAAQDFVNGDYLVLAKAGHIAEHAICPDCGIEQHSGKHPL